jgi:hypothetical protein
MPLFLVAKKNLFFFQKQEIQVAALKDFKI